MFRLASGKSFLLAAFLLVGVNGCGWRSEPDTNAPAPALVVAPEIISEIPFSTLEPEVFQTEIIVSHFAQGEKKENKFFVARSGARRLFVFDAGGENEIVSLAARGNLIKINRRKRIYVEEASGAEAGAGEAPAYIAAELLNRKTPARFENLGARDNLTEFRVRSGDDSSSAETLVFVDENLKLPVRQEFFSSAGGQKVLTVSVELKNFKTQVDETLFQAPKDYKKVSAKEFHQILWREKF